jgi:hypothetical protein
MNKELTQRIVSTPTKTVIMTRLLQLVIMVALVMVILDSQAYHQLSSRLHNTVDDAIMSECQSRSLLIIK